MKQLTQTWNNLPWYEKTYPGMFNHVFVKPTSAFRPAKVLLNVVKWYRGKSRGRPLVTKETFDVALFLGAFSGIYKVTLT
jgi:hypothetical protein